MSERSVSDTNRPGQIELAVDHVLRDHGLRAAYSYPLRGALKSAFGGLREAAWKARSDMGEEWESDVAAFGQSCQRKMEWAYPLCAQAGAKAA